MLTEEHFAMLTSFRIRAMADKLREMIDDPSYDSLTFEERMEMLIDAEASARRDRKISKLVRQARFKLPSACVEDVLYLPGRKLDKDRVTRYAECRWVDDCEVMVVISKTGCGKATYARPSATPPAANSSRCATPASPTSATTSTGRVPPPTTATTGRWTSTNRTAAHHRRLHDHAHRDQERHRPVRDHGGP